MHKNRIQYGYRRRKELTVPLPLKSWKKQPSIKN